MIKKFKQFVKLNEDVEAEPIVGNETPEESTDVSPQDLVSQMSDRLGIDISNYDLDDICSNINLEGLTKNEAKKLVFNYMMRINESKK